MAKRRQRIGGRWIERASSGKIVKNIPWGTYLKRQAIARKIKVAMAKKRVAKKAMSLVPYVGRALDIRDTIKDIGIIMRKGKKRRR